MNYISFIIIDHAKTGLQCSSICITALVALKLKSVNLVDAILLAGGSLGLNVLQKIGCPFRRADSTIDIGELQEKLS